MALFFRKTATEYDRWYLDDDSVFDNVSDEELASKYQTYRFESHFFPPYGKDIVDYKVEEIDGTPTLVPIMVDADLDSVKADRKALLADIRWQKEVGGFVFNGFTFASDDRAQLKYVGILMAAQIDPNYSVNFKTNDGTFVLLDRMGAIGLAMAARTHVQSCFDKEDNLKSQIDAASSVDEVIAIDIESGW